MILVGTNDGTATSHLGSDEFRLDTLACGHECHFFGDDAKFGKMHLGVALVFSLARGYPFGSNFGQAVLGVAVARAGGIVEVEMFAVGEVDATEWDLKDVRVVLDGFVFFGGFAVLVWGDV